MTIKPAGFIGLYLDSCFGEWVDFEGKDRAELYEIAQAIVERYNALPENIGYPAEEFFFADFEGLPFSIGENDFDGAALIGDLAGLVDDEDRWSAIGEWVDNTGIKAAEFSSAQDLLDSFEEDFCGLHDELADYAYDVLEDGGVGKALEQFGLESHLYKLAESVANDWEQGGSYWTARINGKTAIFSN